MNAKEQEEKTVELKEKKIDSPEIKREKGRTGERRERKRENKLEIR